MADADTNSRLSRISTQWTVVLDAHRSISPSEQARAELIGRYLGAVYRYLLGAVRNADVAEDLCQEFATRLLEGKLRNAEPERGRFRDYVKRVLSNLVNDHHRARGRWPQPLAVEAGDPAQTVAAAGDEGDFAAAWREELLNQTWAALQRERPVYHAVLHARIEYPDFTSRQIAEHLGTVEQTALTPANVRKTLERAHARFADLLLEEVARSLQCDVQDDPVREELEDLNLLRYCRQALERRAGKA